MVKLRLTNSISHAYEMTHLSRFLTSLHFCLNVQDQIQLLVGISNKDSSWKHSIRRKEQKDAEKKLQLVKELERDPGRRKEGLARGEMVNSVKCSIGTEECSLDLWINRGSWPQNLESIRKRLMNLATKMFKWQRDHERKQRTGKIYLHVTMKELINF